MFSNRRNRSFGVLLLVYQLFMHNQHVPPVTLVAILIQLGVFLGFIPFLDSHRIGNVCLNAGKVWYRSEWGRLVWSAIVHADDMHLYYNMVSFMWKGRRLERRLGSVRFGVLLCILSLITGICYVAICVILEDQIGYRQFGFMHQCAVGFSGVIFALKVLCNHYHPNDNTWLMGFVPVPSKYACWAELLLIQIMVPNASFLGHLCGIIAGLIYLYGPLMPVVDLLSNAFLGTFGGRPAQYRQQDQHSAPNARFYGSGTVGGVNYENNNVGHGYEPTDYTGGLSEDEQIRRAMYESERDRTRTSMPMPTHWQEHGFQSGMPMPSAPYDDNGFYS